MPAAPNPQPAKTEITFYVDGQGFRSTVYYPLKTLDPVFTVFGSTNTWKYWISFDELYVWNRGLSQIEIQSIYNNRVGRHYPFPAQPISTYYSVSGITLNNSGLNYVLAPLVSFDAPTGTGLGYAASGEAVLIPDEDRIYSDSWPAFSVGNTNNVVSNNLIFTGSGCFAQQDNDFLRMGNLFHYNDWTVFFNLTYTGSKLTGINNIVLSTMSGVYQPSGLLFGINNLDRLFVEYINTEGAGSGVRKIITHQQEMGEHNIVSVSADSINQTISICNHNLAKQTTYGIIYSAPGYTPSNQVYFGGFPNTDNHTRYTGFFGVIKDILVLSGAANPIQMDAIAPVFCLTGYTPESQTPTYSYYPIVTGAQFIETVISSGVTGYSLSSVNIPDKDGADITVYDIIAHNGPISGTGIFYQSGTISGAYITYSGIPESLNYDNAYLLNYADSNFVMLRYPILSGDLIEIYSYTEKWPNKISVIPDAFNVYDFYLYSDLTTGDVNVYHNGLLQLTGIDYVVESGKIVSSSLANYKSVYSYLLYDEISGNTTVSGWTGWTGEYTIPGNITQNGFLDIYLDGQKLISGIDYTINGDNLTLTGTQFGQEVTWSSGTFGFPPARTGNRNTFTGSGLGYWHNFSSSLNRLMDEMVYVNGQRLAPNIDYVTVSPNSMLNTDNRPGGWTAFYVYSGDIFETGVTAQIPDINSPSDDGEAAPETPLPDYYEE